jgi:hypothetical protein
LNLKKREKIRQAVGNIELLPPGYWLVPPSALLPPLLKTY